MQSGYQFIAFALPLITYGTNYYYYYTRLMASFPGQPGEAGTKRQNHSGF